MATNTNYNSCEEPKQTTHNRNLDTEKRKVVWYNPPYSQHVTTRIVKNFFKL